MVSSSLQNAYFISGNHSNFYQSGPFIHSILLNYQMYLLVVLHCKCSHRTVHWQETLVLQGLTARARVVHEISKLLLDTFNFGNIFERIFSNSLLTNLIQNDLIDSDRRTCRYTPGYKDQWVEFDITGTCVYYFNC